MTIKFTRFKEKETEYPIPFQISSKEDIHDQETLLK